MYLASSTSLAYLPNSDEAWASIEPIADIGGRVIALSTANGEGNLFHTLWVGAENRANRFKAMFHPWWANGRDQEWYEQKKEDLPEWQLAQEYPDNPEDAFLKSGRPVFCLEVLRIVGTGLPRPDRRGLPRRAPPVAVRRGAQRAATDLGVARQKTVATPSALTQRRV